MKRVLISACLLGVMCRYDGNTNRIQEIDELKEKVCLIPVCPEQLGGMTTPRLPSEKRDGGVYAKDGTDVTKPFERGAMEAAKIADLFGADMAILKARSPSCGKGVIYDGTFTGNKVAGNGVAAELLMNRGIKVFTEYEIESFLKTLSE